ncbi:hypothetical protein PV733_39195 [Streptomyces europaeiscabiei]|uniref:hypothetical protein n=1 Tax=Streptomyces europaeiscabiei TaxID=146819 RepID=UPI0029BAB424|nr:hypothetical protein [Streptomyces europaeiscabiei]MDX3714855.1 hypothetical protein [Streptomyces europaeiscabiei]
MPAETRGEVVPGGPVARWPGGPVARWRGGAVALESIDRASTFDVTVKEAYKLKKS